MILGTNSSRKCGQQDWILQGTGESRPVLLLACCALLVRAGHTYLTAALDLISEVGCGNYTEREKLF